MADRLDVIELNDIASLEAVRPAWRRLRTRLEDDSPYLMPEFLIPWMRRADNRYRYRVLTAWRAGELVGLAPMVERCIGRSGLVFRIRSFPVFGATPPLDIMIADQGGEVMKAFVDRWLTSGPWDLIELADVPSDSRTGARLAEALEGTGLKLSIESTKTTYVVPVEVTWAEFLASRPRKLRQNLRRGMARCQESGATRVLRYPGDEIPLEQTIAMTLRVIERSWKAATTDRESWERFFRELITELAAGDLLFWRCLMVKGEPIASLLALDYRETLHGFHLVADVDSQRLSPGFLLLADSVQYVHERGYRRFDLGGDADYLHRWANSTRRFDRISVTGNSVGSRLKTRLYQREHRRRLARSERDAAAKRMAMKSAPQDSGEDA